VNPRANSDGPSAPGLRTRRELVRAVRIARGRGERVVFTNGCFDLLHAGHVRALSEARALGDRLVVAVNDDAGVRRLKGPGRPLVPARERAELLAALTCVDWVAIFRAPTPLSLIRALRPDVLAKGGDWPRHAIIGGDAVERWGGQVARLRDVPGIRTSAIVARVRRRSPKPPAVPL
jgi:D-beta-D-heptose 7-phosphate kinase/D-beta-D-heptose 1-phosphate adenosyltransferase